MATRKRKPDARELERRRDEDRRDWLREKMLAAYRNAGKNAARGGGYVGIDAKHALVVGALTYWAGVEDAELEAAYQAGLRGES